MDVKEIETMGEDRVHISLAPGAQTMFTSRLLRDDECHETMLLKEKQVKPGW